MAWSQFAHYTCNRPLELWVAQQHICCYIAQDSYSLLAVVVKYAFIGEPLMGARCISADWHMPLFLC
jgi:hypothetical protein